MLAKKIDCRSQDMELLACRDTLLVRSYHNHMAQTTRAHILEREKDVVSRSVLRQRHCNSRHRHGMQDYAQSIAGGV